MSANAIVEALKTKLYADQTAGSLYSDLGGRLFLSEAPHDAALPLMVWSVIGDDQIHNFGSLTHSMQVQFDFYGKKELGFEVLGDIEAKLFTLLDGFSLSPSGFDRGLVVFTRRMEISVEEDAFRIMDEAAITATD